MADRRKHILLVDDEPEFAFAAAIALRVAGYLVSVAGGGKEALVAMRAAALAGNAIDLLVTDVQMEGMNGKELIRAVRAEWPALPFFLITGYFDNGLGEALSTEGYRGYLLKPFDARQFIDRIARIVEPGDCARAGT